MSTDNNKIESFNEGTCSLQVRIAKEDWEKREIYKLRYQVYAEEMGKPLNSIFNKRKQIFDALDDQSILIYVQTRGEIAATVRLTIAPPEKFPKELAEVFQMNKFNPPTDTTASSCLGLATKLAARPSYRSSPAFYLMLIELYRLLRSQKAAFCFGGCNPVIIPLYERLGFRRFTNNFTDQGYGLLVPFVLILEDTKHMKAIRSPLYRIARNYPNFPDTTHQFLSAFPEALTHHNSQLLTRESLIDYLTCKLGNFPATFPLFKHLNNNEIVPLLLAGVIFSCSPGDCIVTQGTLANELYILLQGTLISSTKKNSTVLQPGDHFGSLTLSLGARQVATVTAVTDADVFVLPQKAFERYQNLYQKSAQTILSNFQGAQIPNSDCIVIK